MTKNDTSSGSGVPVPDIYILYSQHSTKNKKAADPGVSHISFFFQRNCQTNFIILLRLLLTIGNGYYYLTSKFGDQMLNVESRSKSIVFMLCKHECVNMCPPP